MLDGRPYVLKGGTHLYLEAYRIEFRCLGIIDNGLRQFADVMQRVVAEAVHLVQFTLVNRLLPVDVESALHDGSHLIHIIRIEGDDSQPYDVSNVVDSGIFASFELQFAL